MEAFFIEIIFEINLLFILSKYLLFSTISNLNLTNFDYHIYKSSTFIKHTNKQLIIST